MESMKYSDTAFPVSLDPAQVVAEVHANTVNLPKRTVREHIEYALDHPIGAGPLSEAVHPGDKVCIVISDITRRWQQPSAYLPILVERLNRPASPTGHPHPLRHRHPPQADRGGAHLAGGGGPLPPHPVHRPPAATTRSTSPTWAPPAGARRCG